MDNPYSSPETAVDPPLPDSIEMQFTLTADDLAAFNEHFFMHSRVGRFRRWLVPAFAACVALYLLIDLLRKDASLWTILPFVGFIGFLGLLALLITRRRVRGFSRRIYEKGSHLGILGDFVMRLDSGGISTTNEYRRSWVSWKAIEKVVTTKEYVMIFQGSASAFILPFRAFDSQFLFERFAKTAERLRTAALQ